MNRLKYMTVRVLQGLLVLLCIATVNFMLIRAAPGDPVAVIAGEAGASDPQFVAQLREQFGLDKPVSTQLATYLSRITQLDLGFSYRQQRPVLDLIAERLPATLLLTGSAFVMSVIFGVALGATASRHAGKWIDSAITFIALVFYATPLYWLAMMAVLVFSVQLSWLPGFGYFTVGSEASGLARVWDIAQHLVLPSLTLALFYMAVYARMTRASMLEVAQMDFVKTARAKGVRMGRIQRQHILRNALLPIVTLPLKIQLMSISTSCPQVKLPRKSKRAGSAKRTPAVIKASAWRNWYWRSNAANCCGLFTPATSASSAITWASTGQPSATANFTTSVR